MKVLEYNYKTDTEMHTLAFKNDIDGDKLLNDIITARNDKTDTIIIHGPNQTMVISPCEILEMVLKNVPNPESIDEIQ